MSTLDLLLRGRPDELPPADRDFFVEQARRALQTPLTPDQAERIKLVWLLGQYRSAAVIEKPKTPMPTRQELGL